MHAAVARQDRGGGLGVGGGEPGVERAGAVRGQLLLQAGADLGVGAGEVEVVDGAAHVEAGAADEDGVRPSARSRSISARARRWYSATLAVSVTGQMSSSRCGTPPRSASVSLAVPMSMPR